MLQVIDDGVSIELCGKTQNTLFLISILLLGLAVCVAVVIMTAPVKVSIGVVAVFAVLVFGFNIYKNRARYNEIIASGKLIVKNHQFVNANRTVKLSQEAIIEMIDDRIIIKDVGRTWQLLGFENQKELMVAKSILEGKAPLKNERAIRIL